MKLALSLSCVALLAAMSCDNSKKLSGKNGHTDPDATTNVNAGDGTEIGPNGEVIAPNKKSGIVNNQESSPGFSGAAGDQVTVDVNNGTSVVKEGTGNDALDVLEADTAVGLKSGTQILNTFYTVTGIQQPNAALETQYLSFKDSLPGNRKLQSFDAGQQSAIVKLAMEFCNVALDDATLATRLVPGLDMNKAPNAFGDADKANLAKGLVASVWGPVDTGVPAATKEKALVDLTTALIDGLANKTQVASTKNVVKGVCGATLSSLQTILL